MSNTKQWYALYTTSGSEKKVADTLSRRGSDCFYPVNRVSVKPGDRKNQVSVPLFPCIVFARIARADHDAARQIPGVLNMVYWLKEPAVFTDAEIEMLQRFLHEYPCVQLQKAAVIKREMVRISSAGFEKKGGASANPEPVQLYLTSMGYILSAVEANKVELLVRGTARPAKISGDLTIVR